MSATKRALDESGHTPTASDREAADRPKDGGLYWRNRPCCLCGELCRMRWDHEQVVVDRLLTALRAAGAALDEAEVALDEAEARLPGLGSAGGPVGRPKRPASVSCPHCHREFDMLHNRTV